jgi:hypothetical protein
MLSEFIHNDQDGGMVLGLWQSFNEAHANDITGFVWHR